MSGKATLTMNRSRLASTMPAQTIARTWLGFVRLTGMSVTSTVDLRLTLHAPFALDEITAVPARPDGSPRTLRGNRGRGLWRDGDWRLQRGSIANSCAGR